MDSTYEEFHGSTSFTTKGRRTKRQRTTTTTTTTTSSSYIVGVGVGGYVENSYSSSASASATPDDHHDMTTEEEDTANCLILLAHGVLGEKRKRSSSKRSSTPGRLTGAPYECKTCNRTFPSFQALGGHRTSHKKVVTPRPPKPGGQSRHDLKEVGIQVVFPPIRSLKVEISQKITTDSCKPSHTRISNPDKGRVHECSICGSEFPSGQALGGHMRRHRALVAAAPRIEDSGGSSSRNILSLDLDLNLPAADDHEQVIVVDSSHMVETKFHVLPTPAALLDCHY